MDDGQSPHWVTHTLKVKEMTTESTRKSVVRALSKLAGMGQVTADRRKGEVKVTYDLTHQEIAGVEATLVQIGRPVRNDFLERVRLDRIKSMERNRADRLHFDPGHLKETITSL